MDTTMLNAQPPSDHSKTLLHYCVLARNIAMAEYILNKRADPNLLSSDEWGGTPMHYAMEFHLDVKLRVKFVSTLIKRRGRADIPRTYDGRTVLHMAVINEDELILENILAYHPCNLNLNVQDKYGQTAVLDALKLPTKKILRGVIMLDKWTERPLFNVRDSRNGDSRLHLAIVQKLPFSSIQNCIEHMESHELAEKNKSEGKNALMLIEDESKLSMRILNVLLGFEEVIRAINDQDNAGRTALYTAVGLGNKNIVKALLDKGADPNIKSSFIDKDANATGKSPLHVAVESTYESLNSNIDMINLLLDGAIDRPGFRASINEVDLSGGMTPLHCATVFGKHAVMQCLLNRASCNVNAQTVDTRQTALHIALENDDRQGVRMLLMREDIDCNIKNSDGLTPLLASVRRGVHGIIEDLLQRTTIQSLNPNIPDPDTMKSPLVTAIEKEDLVLLKILLQRDNLDMQVFNQMMQSPLHIACERDMMDIVALMLTEGPKYDEIRKMIHVSDNRGRSPMTIAAMRGNVTLCQLLLLHDTASTDLDQENMTLLYSAAWHGQSQLIKELLAANSSLPADSINADEKSENVWTPIHAACFRGHMESVEVLLSVGANVFLRSTSDQPTPFFLACAAGHTHIVQHILELDEIPVSDWDDRFATPLHVAILNEHYHVASLLIEKKMFVNSVAPVYMNYTPLHMVVSTTRQPRIDQFKVLSALTSDPNVDVNAHDNNGYTPLYRACICNNLVAVATLLKHPETRIFNDSDLFHNLAISAAIIRDQHIIVKKMLQVALKRQGEQKESDAVLSDEFVRKLLSYCESVKAKNSAQVIFDLFKKQFSITFDEDHSTWEGEQPVPQIEDVYFWVPKSPEPPRIFIRHQRQDSAQPNDNNDDNAANIDVIDLALAFYEEEEDFVDDDKEISSAEQEESKSDSQDETPEDEAQAVIHHFVSEILMNVHLGETETSEEETLTTIHLFVSDILKSMTKSDGALPEKSEEEKEDAQLVIHQFVLKILEGFIKSKEEQKDSELEAEKEMIKVFVDDVLRRTIESMENKQILQEHIRLFVKNILEHVVDVTTGPIEEEKEEHLEAIETHSEIKSIVTQIMKSTIDKACGHEHLVQAEDPREAINSFVNEIMKQAMGKADVDILVQA